MVAYRSDLFRISVQRGVAMQGETNSRPAQAPASVLAPTSSHMAASAIVSTVPATPKKAAGQEGASVHRCFLAMSIPSASAARDSSPSWSWTIVPSAATNAVAG